MNRSVRTSITSVEFSLRFTFIARHSRLCSSGIFSVRNDEPCRATGLSDNGECRHRFDTERGHSFSHGSDTKAATRRIIRPLPGSALRSNVTRGVQPEPPLLWRLLRNRQLLSSPQTFNPTIADRPACVSQQSCDPPIAIATKLPGPFNHVGNQPILICTPFCHISLGRAMLSQDSAGSALRHFELFADMVDTGTTKSGA